MKATLSECLAASLGSLAPLRLWQATTGVNPIIAYYHVVSDGDVPHAKHLYTYRTVAGFKADLETFCRFLQPISLQDLLESLTSDWRLRANSFLLTFDDGFREMHDVVAPVLCQMGIPATFFLTTACVDNRHMAHHNCVSLLIDRLERTRNDMEGKEVQKVLHQQGIEAPDLKAGLLRLEHGDREAVNRVAGLLEVDFGVYLASVQPYLSSEQTRRLLKMGFAVGGHSVDHPLYSKLSLEEQLYQTRESVRFVRELFALDYGAFAFPHGHNRALPELLKSVLSDGEVAICFGTGGIVRGAHPRHFHRFSMENTEDTAERVLARNYVRSFYKRLMKKC